VPYVYEEGVVPVPANRCTRCGGALEAASAAGDTAGWFEPSTLDDGTWLFASGRDAPEGGTAETLRCGACGTAFALYRDTNTLKHP
jgi:hypothetical protein